MGGGFKFGVRLRVGPYLVCYGLGCGELCV